MKTKLKYLITILLCIAILSISACKSDDEPTNESPIHIKAKVYNNNSNTQACATVEVYDVTSSHDLAARKPITGLTVKIDSKTLPYNSSYKAYYDSDLLGGSPYLVGRSFVLSITGTATLDDGSNHTFNVSASVAAPTSNSSNMNPLASVDWSKTATSQLVTFTPGNGRYMTVSGYTTNLSDSIGTDTGTTPVNTASTYTFANTNLLDYTGATKMLIAATTYNAKLLIDYTYVINNFSNNRTGSYESSFDVLEASSSATVSRNLAP